MAKRQTTTPPADIDVLPAEDKPAPRQAAEERALAKRDREPTFIQQLLQMASSEGVKVEALGPLIDANERLMAIEAKKAFDRAFFKLQAKLKPVKKGGAGFEDRPFSRQSDMMAVLQPLMEEFEFTLRFTTRTEARSIITTGVLTHAKGHSEQDEFASEPDNSGGKNAIQGIGSARQYHRRYITRSLFNIVDEETDRLDTEGEQKQRQAPQQRQPAARPATRQAPQGGQQRQYAANPDDKRPITTGTKEKPGQLERLWAIFKASGRDKDLFKPWLKAAYGYDGTAEIQRRHYDAIIAAIQSQDADLPMPQTDQAAREPGEEG